MIEGFIEEETGKGKMYEIAREVMAVLADKGLEPHEASSVLACCLDWVIQQYSGPEVERFKADTVRLVSDLVYYDDGAKEAAS